MYVVCVGESAQEKFNRIRNREKREMYNRQLEHQDNVIEEAMARGERSIGFFFAYPETRDFYKNQCNAEEWFEYFLESATAQYEANGYTIKGTTISW